jgi:DNA polymerase-1
MTYRSFFADNGTAKITPLPRATRATGATNLLDCSGGVTTKEIQPSSLVTITTLSEAREILATLSGRLVAFDLETTGLDPLVDRPRLLSLAPFPTGRTSVIDLWAAGGLEGLRAELKDLRGVAHNASFDMAFLTKAGVCLSLVDCTMIAAHLAGAETGSQSLEKLAQRFLGKRVDKALQASDWRGPLTSEQIAYAAKDAELVRDLFTILMDRLESMGSRAAYEIVRNALPAIVQMHLKGVPFDKNAHDCLLLQINLDLGQRAGPLDHAFNGRKHSGGDLQEFLSKALGGPASDAYSQWPKTPKGKLSTKRDDLQECLPLLEQGPQSVVRDLLLPHLESESQAKTFGANLVALLHPVTKRLHPHFSLTGTVTGRMSSKKPNIQGFPRKDVFRDIIKAPDGRLLVIADYNAMELRVAAQIANEIRLIEGFKHGADPHMLTAALLLGKAGEAVSKAERQLAKAVNFGLLYGQGAKSLSAYARKSFGVELSIEAAEIYRRAWFEAYPEIRRWQREHNGRCSASLRAQTPAGRIRRWSNHNWGDKTGYRSTEAYNMPIQGGAAECVLVAMALLVRLLAVRNLDAYLIASVHDELIVECCEDVADVVSALLEEAMTFGFLHIFPSAPTTGLVEARKARSWAKA